jgi:hypothetical protein
MKKSPRRKKWRKTPRGKASVLWARMMQKPLAAMVDFLTGPLPVATARVTLLSLSRNKSFMPRKDSTTIRSGARTAAVRKNSAWTVMVVAVEDVVDVVDVVIAEAQWSATTVRERVTCLVIAHRGAAAVVVVEIAGAQWSATTVKERVTCLVIAHRGAVVDAAEAAAEAVVEDAEVAVVEAVVEAGIKLQ